MHIWPSSGYCPLPKCQQRWCWPCPRDPQAAPLAPSALQHRRVSDLNTSAGGEKGEKGLFVNCRTLGRGLSTAAYMQCSCDEETLIWMLKSTRTCWKPRDGAWGCSLNARSAAGPRGAKAACLRPAAPLRPGGKKELAALLNPEVNSWGRTSSPRAQTWLRSPRGSRGEAWSVLPAPGGTGSGFPLRHRSGDRQQMSPRDPALPGFPWQRVGEQAEGVPRARKNPELVLHGLRARRGEESWEGAPVGFAEVPSRAGPTLDVLSEQTSRPLCWHKGRLRTLHVWLGSLVCAPVPDFKPTSPRSLSGTGLRSPGCGNVTASQKMLLVVLFKQ